MVMMPLVLMNTLLRGYCAVGCLSSYARRCSISASSVICAMLSNFW